jgi:sphingosine kinase
VNIIRTKRNTRTLVFVNPAGGSGKAYRLVMEYVVAVWSEAEFPHQIIITGSCRYCQSDQFMLFTYITEYAGHAREFVQSIDLNEWNGIVVASGDGLVYEVFIE